MEVFNRLSDELKELALDYGRWYQEYKSYEAFDGAICMKRMNSVFSKLMTSHKKLTDAIIQSGKSQYIDIVSLWHEMEKCTIDDLPKWL